VNSILKISKRLITVYKKAEYLKSRCLSTVAAVPTAYLYPPLIEQCSQKNNNDLKPIITATSAATSSTSSAIPPPTQSIPRPISVPIAESKVTENVASLSTKTLNSLSTLPTTATTTVTQNPVAALPLPPFPHVTACITSSIYLTDKVKIIIDNLVIEQIRHKDYQSYCFEKLIEIWLGENFLATSTLTLDIKKEMERFEYCKDYMLKTIAKYLPDGENEIYLAYYSFKKNGNIKAHTDGEYIIYHKYEIDVKQLSGYINKLNKKILTQYNNLKYNFEVYLTEKLEDAKMYKLNEDPILRRSPRNTTKVASYKPFLQFNKSKTKRTIKDFLKANTASKKRKVNT